MDLKLLKPGKASPGVVTASDAIFAADYNESLVHQVVTS
ncbi:MAG: 50S ribosomal protein L4, partial [Gammaproteobacteria bacterium]|nr:50S ribosomal protein L4 [Gammaproteobacteria bacterium]